MVKVKAPIYNPHTGEVDKKDGDEESEDHSMSSGTSGTKASGNKKSNNAEGIAASLLVGLRETRWVQCSKLCLLIVLSLCAVACAVTTFVYVKDNETTGFQQQVRA